MLWTHDAGEIVGIVKDYSRQVAIAVVCFSLLAVGALDYVTGPDLSFSFFYLVSVAISVILLDRIAGVICSFCAGGITLLEQLGEHTATNIALWNAGMRLGTLLVAAFILHKWWRTRQEGCISGGASQSGPPGQSRMLKKVLGTVGLVYIPFAFIVFSEYYLQHRYSRNIWLAFFYLLPLIAAVALTRLRGAVIYSIFASAAFLILQRQIQPHPSWAPCVWNALMRLAVLLTIAQALWSAVNAKPRNPDPV
jgi:hypothetical protein